MSVCVSLLLCQGSRDPDKVGSQQSSRLVEPGGPDVWYDDRISKLELCEMVRRWWWAVLVFNLSPLISIHSAPLYYESVSGVALFTQSESIPPPWLESHLSSLWSHSFGREPKLVTLDKEDWSVSQRKTSRDQPALLLGAAWVMPCLPFLTHLLLSACHFL